MPHAVENVGLSESRVRWLTVGLSVGFHFALVGAGSWLAYRSLDAEGPRDIAPPAPEEGTGGGATIAIDLPLAGSSALLEDRAPDPTGELVRLSGGETVARPDQRMAGRGGDG